METFDKLTKKMIGCDSSYSNAEGPAISIDDIRALNTFKIDNNRAGVISALSNMGIATPAAPTRSDLGNILLNLYNSSYSNYIAFFKSVPFNPAAGNYTTDAKFLAALNAEVKKLSDKI